MVRKYLAVNVGSIHCLQNPFSNPVIPTDDGEGVVPKCAIIFIYYSIYSY